RKRVVVYVSDFEYAQVAGDCFASGFVGLASRGFPARSKVFLEQGSICVRPIKGFIVVQPQRFRHHQPTYLATSTSASSLDLPNSARIVSAACCGRPRHVDCRIKDPSMPSVANTNVSPAETGT